MLGVGLGVFMATVDVSIVNIALPTLVKELSSDFPTIQWVTLAYILVITSLMLGVARLGDMLGHKRVYMTGLIVFSLGSLFCGLSPSAGTLIASRVFQGVGAVMMQALGMALITQVFPAKERGRSLGMVGAMVSLGLSLGPALGGLLIAQFGWRSIFLVNVPLGVIAVLVIHFAASGQLAGRGHQHFDAAGGVAFFATLACYAMGMTLGQRLGFTQAAVVGLFVLTALLTAVFVEVERRVEAPMLDLKIFSDRLLSLNLLMCLLAFITVGGMLILPFFLDLVKGYGTERVGLLMMVMPVTMGLVAPAAGVVSDRLGSRGLSLTGLLVLAGGCMALAGMGPEVDTTGFIWRAGLVGIGLGLFQTPNNSAVMGRLPRERLGVGSGLLALGRTLGHATGISLMGTVFYAKAYEVSGVGRDVGLALLPRESLVAGLDASYGFAAMAALLAAGLAAWAWRVDRRKMGVSRS